MLEGEGLNKYLFEMANIRDQDSWVHSDDKQGATTKAKKIVESAVAKAINLAPLEDKYVPVEKAAMVIGGGVAGIFSALELANMGNKVYLVEKEPSIGGVMAQLDKTFPTNDCSACILTPVMVDAGTHPNIDLLTYSEMESVDGYIGNFDVKIRRKQSLCRLGKMHRLRRLRRGLSGSHPQRIQRRARQSQRRLYPLSPGGA